ncbi:hypothetical protein [Shewanella frigidimarina]|uniref:Uncharacterized protein n=1 Tax=Shewanella frigidimarina TaxID=56812 RepID=A0A119CZK6_SHEFR|nr:hypothetical protein [Shewanella frigidimarina]KVX01522.1 hypothetical protein AWJ07_17440 [Shewanella frigidimarina]
MNKIYCLILLFYPIFVYADNWPGIEFPDSAVVEIVADDMTVYGFPMRTWIVKDKKSQMMMANFFAQQWRNNSDKYDAQMFNGDYVINSLQSSFLLTARIHREDDGVTVYVGVTQNIEQDKASANKKDFPTPNKSIILSDVQSTDIYKHGHTLVIQSGESLSASYHFYRRYYQRRGWAEISAKLSPQVGKAVLQMSKGADIVDISFNTKKSKIYIVANQVKEGR